MRQSWLLLVAPAALMLSCNQTLPDDIPCQADEHCPTDYWCFYDTCRPNEISTPPSLVLVGVRATANEAYSRSVTVEATRLHFFHLAVKNIGGSDASFLRVALWADACLHLDKTVSISGNGVLGPTTTLDASVSVNPDPGCTSPAQVTVEMSSGGSSHVFRDAFQVVLQ